MLIKDLKLCQQQMCDAVKKYIEYMSTNAAGQKAKKSEKCYLELLREIILINEKQKIVLSALRLEKSLKKGSESLNSDGALSESEKAYSTEDRISSTSSSEADFALNLISFKSNGDTKSDKLSCLEETESSAQSEFVTLDFNGTSEDLVSIEDFQELVTCNEFMHSIGLLTIDECVDVLEKRRERQKKNAYNHVFCQSIWEKHETKRKKRDWLLSTSPPQLRRKNRGGSQQSSQQVSRSASPLDGATSPSSSFSPSSPLSPSNGVSVTRNLDEVCSLCQEKGASIQCEGCGSFYHHKCVDVDEIEHMRLSLDWLCPPCEQRGLRNSGYKDPLQMKLAYNVKNGGCNVPRKKPEKDVSFPHSKSL